MNALGMRALRPHTGVWRCVPCSVVVVASNVAPAGSGSGSGRARLSGKSKNSLLDQSMERGSATTGLLEDAAAPAAPAAANAGGGGPAGVPRFRAGTLQSLPVVADAKTHLESALKRASRVMPTPGLKTAAAKARNLAAKQLDELTKELAGPLGMYVRGFPAVARLHPFEHALVEITVGPGVYERTLSRVDSLRKGLLSIGKAHAARAAASPSQRLAEEVKAEGVAAMQVLFASGASAVNELVEVAKQLRALPVAEPTVPTLVLVGAPNVGKSSLIRLLSSGVPEVCNYPFTTRSIQMGHFFVDLRRHVVTDTPGLLARPDGARNRLERLTLISLEHLQAAVLFVCDLSGTSGTTVEDQLAVRAELRDRFRGRPWLDCLSKIDTLKPGTLTPEDVTDAMRVSAVTEEGLPQLRERIIELLRTDDAAAKV